MMMPIFKIAVLCSVLVPGCAAENPQLLCSIEKPLAEEGDTVQLKAWLAPPPSAQPDLKWSADAGRIREDDLKMNWLLADAPVGRHVVQVSISQPANLICSLELYVVRPSRDGRETARGLLAPGKREQAGYGLYSYLLFASAPDDTERDRYLRTVEAYLRLSPALEDLANLLDAKNINATYLLIDGKTPQHITAEWVLQHYDYARGSAMLRSLPGSHLHGPYLLSSLLPVAPGKPIAHPYLFQDLSKISPSLAGAWYEEFVNQAAQDHFWEERKGQQFVLKLRTTISILALGLPDVQSGLESWMKWIK
jgi:hypothetical protein